jgi:hypothetical protein
MITTFRFKCQLLESVCTEHDLYSVALAYFEFVAGDTYEDVHLVKIRTVLYLDYLLHERAPGSWLGSFTQVQYEVAGYIENCVHNKVGQRKICI